MIHCHSPLVCRRALHDLPQQREQRHQGHVRELKSQATKKTAFNHRAIAERLAELEKEKAAVVKVYFDHHVLCKCSLNGQNQNTCFLIPRIISYA